MREIKDFNTEEKGSELIEQWRLAAEKEERPQRENIREIKRGDAETEEPRAARPQRKRSRQSETFSKL